MFLDVEILDNFFLSRKAELQTVRRIRVEANGEIMPIASGAVETDTLLCTLLLHKKAVVVSLSHSNKSGSIGRDYSRSRCDPHQRRKHGSSGIAIHPNP